MILKYSRRNIKSRLNELYRSIDKLEMRVKKLESFIDSSMDRYPHGSIVLLKEGKKKLVIYGRKQILLSGEEPKMYDYLGCFFPEGYINQDYSFVFNHEDIEEILFIGFINEEEK